METILRRTKKSLGRSWRATTRVSENRYGHGLDTDNEDLRIPTRQQRTKTDKDMPGRCSPRRQTATND